MFVQHIITEPNYLDTITMIDGEFDCFEPNNDFEMGLREAENTNFYHTALNEEA